jgi:hypothetical protein
MSFEAENECFDDYYQNFENNHDEMTRNESSFIKYENEFHESISMNILKQSSLELTSGSASPQQSKKKNSKFKRLRKRKSTISSGNSRSFNDFDNRYEKIN